MLKGIYVNVFVYFIFLYKFIMKINVEKMNFRLFVIILFFFFGDFYKIGYNKVIKDLSFLYEYIVVIVGFGIVLFIFFIFVLIFVVKWRLIW